MQIPLIHGRDLSQHDDLNHERVVLVKESFVRQFFHQNDPIGKCILEDYGAPKQYIESWVWSGTRDGNHLIFTCTGGISGSASDRAGRASTRYTNGVAESVADLSGHCSRRCQLDPDVPLYDLCNMEWYSDYQTANRRFPPVLLSGFAALAMILASIGLHSLISAAVAQRAKELGIRIALVAQKAT
ncbi:MAG TPA: hypothetical protein VKV15_01495 [Bryobacteraceae bacterium]|nr:hypothetical protein [Bryobacteraceae bacterium]